MYNNEIFLNIKHFKQNMKNDYLSDVEWLLQMSLSSLGLVTFGRNDPYKIQPTSFCEFSARLYIKIGNSAWEPNYLLRIRNNNSGIRLGTKLIVLCNSTHYTVEPWQITVWKSMSFQPLQAIRFKQDKHKIKYLSAVHFKSFDNIFFSEIVSFSF